MTHLTGCCFLLLLSTSCCANTEVPSTTSTLPPGLVKVNDEINPKCVEYVAYNGELYCSLVPFDKNAVNPNLVSYEPFKIKFDQREWKAVWGKKEEQITTVEYVPVGDNIKDWHELITTQFFPKLNEMTPQEFMDRFIQNLKKSEITFTTNIIETQPNQSIFEFKVEKPTNLQQDEIQKVVKGKDGLYVIHYAIKQADMDEANRKKWIDNLKNSTLKEP